jgi:hypothetical protein
MSFVVFAAQDRIKELEAATANGHSGFAPPEVGEVQRLKDALRKLQAVHLSEKQASAATLATLENLKRSAVADQSRLHEAEAEVLRLESRVLELEEENQDLAQVGVSFPLCFRPSSCFALYGATE